MTKVGLKACTSAEISCTICELLEWKRANGGLKNHECRQLLERLQEQGWLRLPPVRRLGPRGPRRACRNWCATMRAVMPAAVRTLTSAARSSTNSTARLLRRANSIEVSVSVHRPAKEFGSFSTPDRDNREKPAQARGALRNKRAPNWQDSLVWSGVASNADHRPHH